MPNWTIHRALLIASLSLLSAPGQAQDLNAGKLLAGKHCVRCHAIGPNGPSRLASAPTFRTIANRYSVWTLQESLAEGIVTGHAAMPVFVFNPDEITNLLSYMDTLATKKHK